LPIILNIETATSLCSVSLAKNGKVLSIRETQEEKSHARLLSVFISEIMQEQGFEIKDLDGVAVGKGPGSYTGLRIGVSTAKGICFGANIPMLAIGTLQILCDQVFIKADLNIRDILRDPSTLICPMIDARRMEVYYSLFNNHGKEVSNAAAEVINNITFLPVLAKHTVIFTGSGMNKCREILNHPNAILMDHIHPSAQSLARLSYKAFQNDKFVNLAYFEPFYLKDFIGTVPKKRLQI